MSGFIVDLFSIIEDRKQTLPEGSYTTSLFQDGEDRIIQKVGEESIEVILAAKGQGEERLVSEMADLTYHCLVLLAYKGLSPEDIVEELKRRHQS